MKRIASIRMLEDCIDSVVAKEFAVTSVIDETLMQRMVDGGSLQFFPRFPKPYFRIDKKNAYVIQGILGEDSFRVTYSPSAKPNVEQRLKNLIEYGEGSISEAHHD